MVWEKHRHNPTGLHHPASLYCRIIPATCLTLCLPFLPQHALTLNPLFMLPNQGWDTECSSSSMLPLLEERASREGRQQSLSWVPSRFPTLACPSLSQPSSGIKRGHELSTVTQLQDNSTPTFLEQLLTKGFNHSVKRIQGQIKLEIKKKRKKENKQVVWSTLYETF